MGRGRICRVYCAQGWDGERREGEGGAGVWCKYLLEIVCADTIGIWNTAYLF